MDNKNKTDISKTINWYPGHMTKAVRMMEENLKLIDLVIELVDARVPISSKNPDIDRMANGKFRLICLNKSDLADDRKNDEWIKHYQEKGFSVLKINSRTASGLKNLNNVIMDICKEKIERDQRRGIKNRPIRAMICGIPNVGKSTFINSVCKKAVAKTGNKPGVTKGKQWIRINKNIELLDTPGILWPKFEDKRTGINLGLIGSINDDILDQTDLACELIKNLKTNYTGVLNSKYELDESLGEYEILEGFSNLRGCLKKGGEIDIEKGSRLLIDDFRNGKILRVTLEFPEM